MRRQVNNAISVLYTALRVAVFRLVHGSGFQSGWVQRISPNVVMEFNRGSRVTLGKHVRIHSDCKLKVRPSGKLIIGDNVKMNYHCIVGCHHEIFIGEGTEFGPSVYLYDHDHDYRAGMNADSNQEKFLYAPIYIGKQCWIGANTVILRGSSIGDHCVIGAGCVIKGTIPDGSVVIQKREQTIQRRTCDD